jgi:hypothetical protein
MKLQKIKAGVKEGFDSLAHDGFRKIFEHIDQLGIKKGVDTMGLDKFIESCARLAAGTGIISGSGGIVTMAVGVPVDVINMITQQFRVTLAVIYNNRGNYNISFDEFISVVAASMKIEAGVALTRSMLEAIAEKIMLKIGTKLAGRLVPVVGGVIGGTANYLFIKGMANEVKKMQPEYFPIN